MKDCIKKIVIYKIGILNQNNYSKKFLNEKK